MNPDYSALWFVLRTEFDDVARRLKENQPRVWARSEWRSNDTFPFSAHLSVVFGDPRVDEEDAVLSLVFHSSAEGLAFNADLSTGAGVVLAEGTNDRFNHDAPDSEKLAWMQSCINRSSSFIRKAGELIAALPDKG